MLESTRSSINGSQGYKGRAFMPRDNTFNSCLLEMLLFLVDRSQFSVSQEFFACVDLRSISNLRNAFVEFHCHLPNTRILCFTRLCIVKIYLEHLIANFIRIGLVLQKISQKNLAYVLLRHGIGILTKHDFQVLQVE